MTWANKEVQKTVYEILSSDEILQNLLGAIPESINDVGEVIESDTKIYDYVPQESKYPYAVIGFDPQTDRGSHTTEGWTMPLRINTWSRKPNRGRSQLQDIQARIDFLLHKQDICIEGWNIINLRRDSCHIIQDMDSVTYQGIQTFNLLIGEASWEVAT